MRTRIITQLVSRFTLHALRSTCFMLLFSSAAGAGDLTVGDLEVTNDATIHGQLNFVSEVGFNGPVVATGGTITESGGSRIHTFTSSGQFEVSGGTLICEVLVVAGGGGGDLWGGGGAGGLVYAESYVVPEGVYSVTIGQGGNGGNQVSANGQDSIFASINAVGGGHGQSFFASGKPVGNGGSGGGGHDQARGGKVGLGIPGQGHDGALGASDGLTYTVGGGGGGAGEPGHAGTSSAGGAGGNGLAYDISGATVYYAGGGGGGGTAGRPGGAGGLGGGGGGGDGASGVNGAPNTGGGGGGGGSIYTGSGAGGSGIVIIRYSGGYVSSLTISSNGINQLSASAVNVFKGKVGIGTENPTAQLQVSGNLRVDGAVTLGGETRTNWVSVADSLVVSNLQAALGFVVGRPGEAPFTTIQAAINAAVAAGHGLTKPVTIEIKPGRYTNDLALQAGIHLKAEVEDGLFSVVIVGNQTYNYTGTADGDLILSGIAFYSPGVTATTPLFRVAGNGYTSLRLNHCVLQVTDNGPALRLENTGTKSGRPSNTEMFHSRVRGLKADSTATALVELNSGSLLMDEADIYLADATDRSFRAVGISQLLLDSAQVRGRIETANNAYLQLSQSSIDSGAQPCIVHNSTTPAIGFEVLLNSLLPATSNLVTGIGPFFYNNIAYFNALGIVQRLGPTALPALTENAYNLIYRAAFAADWSSLGGRVPTNVNLALDMLASRVAAAPVVENDPQVGANILNYVPRWDGSALVKGSIYDPGSGTVRIDGALTLGGETRTNWPTMAVGALLSANNLSDVADAATARSNLGLGTAAINDTADFLNINGGTVDGAVIFNGLVSVGGPLGDIPMGIYTNR